MCQNNESRENWPLLGSVTSDELANKVAQMCIELNRRQEDARARSLEAAQKIWPSLKRALRENGRILGLNNSSEPIMPEWSEEPVVGTAGNLGGKARNKREAMGIALTVGDGGWATIGELWLWVGGGGPLVDRTLQKLGFLKKTEEKKKART